MTRSGRHSADDALAAALAAGATVRDAAALANVSEKTAHRRNGEPAFRAKVAALRAEMVGAATGALAASMVDAGNVLRRQLANSDEHLAHKAAVRVIELGLKAREHCDLTAEVARLSDLLAARDPTAANLSPQPETFKDQP